MQTTDFIQVQQRYCLENSYVCDATEEYEKVGFALDTQGKVPVNGLRHRREGNTSGWYLWCGEEFSSDPHFFSPIHSEHLVDRCPEAIKFLGLTPGHRFLVIGECVDVWFDSSLLDDVEE